MQDLTPLDLVALDGRSNAVAAAMNYQVMRKEGVTVRKTIDVLIGTYCIENDVVLLHDDQNFVPMEEQLGKQVVGPGAVY